MTAPPSCTLRPARSGDTAFLFRLYASTRANEMAGTGWPAAQQEAFLRSQFAARSRDYAANYPRAAHQIVLVGRAPAGALIVDRAAEEIRVVDIALLPAQRGKGIGRRLLGGLIAEAGTAGRPLRLQVLKTNRAARLYAQLGFTPAGEDGLYLKMEWRAGRQAPLAGAGGMGGAGAPKKFD